ncbi:FMN-dependent NADH-azoreductase [Tsukamurella spumae]|uniref:FMN dependent NADH:quinone oxidoreductase n=1 Tax=Tsukamurella spumae TaxID=44753 RepID=A0A846X746_9ACTN|nr:NAD(P)H-dependent oxidoreductase [Tsukamurella spumae]NKY19590.1 flavodoxin family protein [Tsukamurella spumae]
MARLLHVNASPLAEHSKSLSVATEYLDEYRRHHPDVEIDRWDLFDADLPDFGVHAAGAKMATFFGQEQTPEQRQAWAAAREVFDRVAAADAYLFNIPMWNHGLPYVLKHWIDLITQPGWSFGFDPATGYSGLLQGRSAVVVYTCGVYGDGLPPAFGTDFLTPYFDDWLRFVGIEERESVKVFGQVIDPEAAATVERSLERVRALAARV